MNTEDFVTYEQAVALKKLGFREECLYYYKDGEIYPNCGSLSAVIVDDYYDTHNWMSDSALCDAPTLWEVQKWLRRAKNIIVLSTCNLDYKNGHSWYWFVDANIEVEEPEQSYDTPEEALSAGITECLKLLEENSDVKKVLES